MIVSLTIMLMVAVVMIVVMLVRIITVLLVTSWWRQWWCWWYWTLWLSLRQAACMSAEIRMKDIWKYDYMHIYWCILKIVDVIEASCLQERWDLHEGRLSCWFELYCHGLPIQRLTIIMVVIIVMIVINIIIVVMIKYQQWLCLPGCDVPILTGVVNPSPKMETSGRLQLIHEEALHGM